MPWGQCNGIRTCGLEDSVTLYGFVDWGTACRYTELWTGGQRDVIRNCGLGDSVTLYGFVDWVTA